MDIGSKFQTQLREDYSFTRLNEIFLIDEHAYQKCKDHINLDLDDVLAQLKQGQYVKAEINDSGQGWLERFNSYNLFIAVSRQYMYCVVVYMTPHKPLIKTVYQIDKSEQEQVWQ